jgi:hypothetical protein
MKPRNHQVALCLAFLFTFPFSAFADGSDTGRVIDFATKRPIPGAIVTLPNEVLRTDERGIFAVKSPAAKVGVRAYGYRRAEVAFPSPSSKGPVDIGLLSLTPKALYMTYYGIGDRGLRNSALKLIDDTELNALVIDVKGDRGVVTYKTEVPFANQIGAQKLIIVKDIRELLRSLKERGIYTIARIVVFKDNVLGSARPDLTVRTQDGRVWRDREDLVWVDPSKPEVWEYNINLAVEAARNGFDEIQFDYVRFPDKKGLKFGVENSEENRVKYISGFLKEAKRRLAPYNVFLAVDIFGYASWNLDDTQIGQRLDAVEPQVDYISLMLYPSGFQFGIPGYRNPVAHPYEIVSLSLKKAQERTAIRPVRFRPWLQAFRDYAFDRRHFHGPEIETQIKASEDFGSGGWMLWNPRNVYLADGLKRRAKVMQTGARMHDPQG